MESFYPKGNWVKWKSRIEESVESLIKWVFEKTVNKSWQSRWETNANFALNIYENPYKWRVYAVYKGFFVGKL